MLLRLRRRWGRRTWVVGEEEEVVSLLERLRRSLVLLVEAYWSEMEWSKVS